MKKVYLDPNSYNGWINFKPDTNPIWERTSNLNEADCLLCIDSDFSILTDKPKLLALIEPENILNSVYGKTYNNLIKKFNSNTNGTVITHHKKWIDNSRIFYSPPPFRCWVKEAGLFNKTKLCSMISSNKNLCAGHQKRLDIANKFKDKLDLYGLGFNRIENKNQGLNDYCFSIVVENYQTPGYYTEKVLDCFLTGVIPIYLGDSDIGSVYNPNGIITYNDNFDIKDISIDLYVSKFSYIFENYQKSVINYQKNYNTVTSFISNGIQKI